MREMDSESKGKVLDRRKDTALHQGGKQRMSTEMGAVGGGKMMEFPSNCFYFLTEIQCKVIGGE